MKQLIFIKTTPKRYSWLENMMKTLSGYDKYPIFIYSSKNPWWMEPSLLDYLKADQMVFLHDSLEITDTAMFDMVFSDWKDDNVAFIGNTIEHSSVFNPYSMQLAKFKYDLLKKINYVDTQTKEQEYDFEQSFCSQYAELAPNPKILIPDFQANEAHAERVEFNGRMNHKIITKYFIKYRSIVSSEEARESMI